MTQSVELTEGGKSVLFTDRKVPWMKLGEITDGALTAKEAAEKSGLNFTVSLHDVYFTCEKTIVDMTNDADGTDIGTKVVDNIAPDCLRKMTNRKIVVRDDTLEPLSIVSAGYPVLQYCDAFDFMDTVNTQYVAAGSLKGGRQGFMVVRAPDEMQINVLDGGDPHDMFMVLRTSHDLTRAVEVTAMPLRGKCMNQLTLSSFAANIKHRWSIKHTSTMTAKLAEAQSSIQHLSAYTQRFNELAQRLAAIKVNDEKAKFILIKHVLQPNAAKKEETADTIIEKWHSAPTVGWAGTGWGLVNAVSEHYEWGRSGGSPESRFLAALEGQTHKAINKTALLLLRETAKK